MVCLRFIRIGRRYSRRVPPSCCTRFHSARMPPKGLRARGIQRSGSKRLPRIRARASACPGPGRAPVRSPPEAARGRTPTAPSARILSAPVAPDWYPRGPAMPQRTDTMVPRPACPTPPVNPATGAATATAPEPAATLPGLPRTTEHALDLHPSPADTDALIDDAGVAGHLQIAGLHPLWALAVCRTDCIARDAAIPPTHPGTGSARRAWPAPWRPLPPCPSRAIFLRRPHDLPR